MKTYFCAIAFLVSCSLNADILTYEQALALASAQNLDLEVAKARQLQAQSLVYKMLSPYLPRLTATGTYTHNSNEVTFKVPQPSGTFKEITIQPSHLLNMQVQLTQMLISPWSLFQATSAPKYVRATKLALEQARRDIAFAVAQLYYAAAASKEAVSAQNRLLLGRKKHEHVAELRVKEGYAIKAEGMRAKIDTAKNEQDLILAENAYLAQKLAMATLFNRDADFEITEPPKPSLPSDNAIAAATKALNRPDLKAAQIQDELAGRNNRLAFLRYLPELSSFVQYKNSNNAGFGSKENIAVGLNLTWNIFDGGMREAEIFENSAKAMEAHANARIKQLTINKDIEQAKLDLKSAIATRDTAVKQLELARENFRIVSASKDAGVATYLEYGDASDNLANAEIGVITNNYKVSIAALKLQHELGVNAK